MNFSEMTDDLRDIIKRLRAHGAETSIGYLYGNLSEQLLNLSVDEQNLNLIRAIAGTVARLEQRI